MLPSRLSVLHPDSFSHQAKRFRHGDPLRSAFLFPAFSFLSALREQKFPVAKQKPQRHRKGRMPIQKPVSYTHLTLPTIA